jgi:hypothetical protein
MLLLVDLRSNFYPSPTRMMTFYVDPWHSSFCSFPTDQLSYYVSVQRSFGVVVQLHPFRGPLEQLEREQRGTPPRIRRRVEGRQLHAEMKEYDREVKKPWWRIGVGY